MLGCGGEQLWQDGGNGEILPDKDIFKEKHRDMKRRNIFGK